MSVGAVDPPPFDPNAQDPAKVQAMLAAPPPPVAIPDATSPPPAPAPGPTDIPAPPAPFVPPDAGAIANSASPQALAANLPPPAPGAAPAMPPPEKTPSQIDDLKKAQDEEAKAREASDKAQLDVQKSQQPTVEERNQLLQQQVDHLKAAQVEQQKQRDQFDTAQLAANTQLKQTQDLIKKFKYKDYFSNEDGSTNWGLKIGSALAAGLGAYGAGLTHGPNYALQILNKNMDDWHQSQVDHLNQLKDEEVSQRTGIQDAQLARQKAMSDLTLKDAGFDKLIASQLDASAARQSSASFAPSLTAAAAKLKLDAAEKETAAKKLGVELNLKLGDEERKRRGEESTIAKNNAEAGLANAKAGHLKAGHGVEPAMSGAVAAVSDYIKKNPDDQPGQYALAEKLGFKGQKAAALVDKLQNDFKKTVADRAESEDTIVRDESGAPIGRVPTGRGGAQGFQTRDSDYGRALTQLEALKKDIDDNGSRVFSPDAAKRRAQLKENADIAVATVSPLGKTDEAMKKEAASIGSSGAYTVTGASPDAIARKINELKEQRSRYQKETLIPLHEGESERLTNNRVPVSGNSQAKAAPAKSLNVGGVVRHYDEHGKRLP